MLSGTALHERQITAPVDLAGPDGRLNPDAVGWTRTPLHRTGTVTRGLVGRTRTKRWEYWAVTTPTHAGGLVVSDISYATVHGIFVLDRRTGEQAPPTSVPPDRGCGSRPSPTGRPDTSAWAWWSPGPSSSTSTP